MAAQRTWALPSPRVSFAPDFLTRLGRLTLRLASASERREGAGAAHLSGAGLEFVGYRPYRAGEDLRQLDWGLYARLRRPFVRVSRREASEQWAVLVDTSASMAVGEPGKLQLAAEVATAIAATAAKRGALVELFVSGRDETVRLAKQGQLGAWMRFFEGLRAQGERGLGALAREPARFREAGTVFLLGDLLDLEPPEALSLARRGRELYIAQLLAPEELAPTRGSAVRWIDAETGHARAVEVDGATHAAYEELLAKRLEAWGAACQRHRAAYGFWRSSVPFETVTTGLFDG